MGKTECVDRFLEKVSDLERQLSIKEQITRLEGHMSLVKDLHETATSIETGVRWVLGQLAIMLSDVKASAGQEDAEDAVLLDLALLTKNAAGDRCCPCQCHAKNEPAPSNSGDGTQDWKPPEGSDVTVADLVKKAAQEAVDSSDYIFNEEYQMYYSVSTGCYYDPSTQLLYEPASGTYYRYNTEMGTYEVHSQVEPTKARKTRKPKRKSHAELRYSEEQGGYLLKDLQSQAGTSLNGVTLEQGQESLVQHMDRLQLGAVQLEAHIHKGTNTCTRCEPGLMDTPSGQQESQGASSPSSETKRRAQLKKLKAKYGLQGMQYTVRSPPRGYQDRAQERRGTVGSKFPHERESEPASVDRPLAQDNIGFKLLNKMGWKEGAGLGKHEQGATEPVKVSSKNTRTGLGHSGPKVEDQRTHILNKTRERYQAIAEKEASAVLSPKQENT